MCIRDRRCDSHANRFECPDALVHYSPRARTYGLIVHDGGSSFVAIAHCPWCGANLKKKELAAEARLATRMLRGKSVKRVWRHGAAELGIEFEDGARLFVDAKTHSLDLSIT